MIDEIRNIILAGIGSAALTYEKSSELIDNLVKKGQITLEQGRELSEELKRNTSTKEEETKLNIGNITREEIVEIINEVNLTTKQEINMLKSRIEKLETIINNK